MPRRSSKKPTGRPSFAPTDEQRKTVRAMSGYGVPQPEIAKVLQIDDKTLRKYFRAELDVAATHTNAKVAETLFRMATRGDCPAATIFWMKVRAGWRDRDQGERGPGGDDNEGAAPRGYVQAPPPAKTKEEWAELVTMVVQRTQNQK